MRANVLARSPKLATVAFWITVIVVIMSAWWASLQGGWFGFDPFATPRLVWGLRIGTLVLAWAWLYCVAQLAVIVRIVPIMVGHRRSDAVTLSPVLGILTHGNRRLALTADEDVEVAVERYDPLGRQELLSTYTIRMSTPRKSITFRTFGEITADHIKHDLERLGVQVKVSG